MNWNEAQEWERDWHGTCANTLNEEIKQLGYAEKMGLQLVRTPKTPYTFNLRGAVVADVGGGPASLLLKCMNIGNGSCVIDPCDYPQWVRDRYNASGIRFMQLKGEQMFIPPPAGWPSPKLSFGFDEIWIYNCLQHTEDWKLVITNAKKLAKLIRIFEWIDTPVTSGHIHTLRAAELDKLLDGEGKVEVFNGQRGLGGPAYYGIFPTGGVA